MTMQLETDPTAFVPPEWTQGDRMHKSLRLTGISVQEMADYLGVARNTVSTWINDRNTPNQRTMMLWAVRTGYPQHWLERGHVLGELPLECQQCAARDSNPEPAGMGPVIWAVMPFAA